MKVKLAEIEGSLESLTMLSTTRMPAVGAFKVARILRALQAPLESFQIAKNKILIEHGQPTKDQPGRYSIPVEVWDEHAKELMSQEVDVPVEPLTITDFGHVEIAPGMLANLTWCIQV